MADLLEELYSDVLKRAIKAHVNIKQVTSVFFDAYGRHKAEHGSFKYHPKYDAAMSERYHHMHDKTIAFINSEAEKSKKQEAHPERKHS